MIGAKVRTRLILFLLTLLFAVGCIQRAPRIDAEYEASAESKVRQLLRLGTAELRQSVSLPGPPPNPGAQSSGPSETSLERAEAFFQLALELKPEDSRALDGLGSIAFRRGERLVALRYFQRAIMREPQYDRPYEHLAAVAGQNGDSEAAKSLLLRAIDINPLNFRARNNLALLLRREFGGERPKDNLATSELLRGLAALSVAAPKLPDDQGPLERNLQAEREATRAARYDLPQVASEIPD